MATGLQTLLQAFDAAMQGSWPRFGLWMFGSITIVPLTVWAEKIKGIEVE